MSTSARRWMVVMVGAALTVATANAGWFWAVPDVVEDELNYQQAVRIMAEPDGNGGAQVRVGVNLLANFKAYFTAWGNRPGAVAWATVKDGFKATALYVAGDWALGKMDEQGWFGGNDDKQDTARGAGGSVNLPSGLSVDGDVTIIIASDDVIYTKTTGQE